MASCVLLYTTVNWPSAARYAGGFHAAGCEVHAACPAGALARRSRYVTASHRYNPFAPLSSLRKAIARSAACLVVVCDDRALAQLVRLYHAETSRHGEASEIAGLIRRSLGAPENYARVISRYGSLADMRAQGVSVPACLPVDNEADLDDGLAVLGLPAVLKADGSWGGNGVAIVHTKEEARAAFRKLSRAPSRLRSLAQACRYRDAHFAVAAFKPEPRAVCMQKFVAGRMAASAFAARDGEVLAAFHYDMLVTDGDNGPPTVIRRVESPEMDAAVKAAAACFDLSGLHGLDFLRDETGAVHLIELNPRATQGGTLPFGEGRDLPSALAHSLVPGASGRRGAIENDLVAFFPQEAMRQPDSPYLKTAYHDIPEDDRGVLMGVQRWADAARARRALRRLLQKSLRRLEIPRRLGRGAEIVP